MKMINFILFLIILLYPVILLNFNDNDTIIFNGISYSENFTEYESKFLQIIFEEPMDIKYLQIELLNINKTKNQNFAIAFSDVDKECLNREQLSYGLNNIQMWLTEEQIIYKRYINIMCISYPCSYELKLTAFEKIEIGLNSQFNLYVTEKNKEIEVLFKTEFLSDVSEDYLTIWAIGNKNVTAEFLSIDYTYLKYSKNNIFKINKEKTNDTDVLLRITGEEGDVINIGSRTIYSNEYNKIGINQPEIKGYLNREYNSKDCYEFSKDSMYESSQYFYSSGIIYSKIGEIYYKNVNDKDEETSIIKNGSFIQIIKPDKEKENYFCIGFPTTEIENYDIDEIYYSLQLTNPNLVESKIDLYSSQIYGGIYPRILDEGQSYSYLGVSPNDSTKQIYLDMISKFGFPDMYYRLCKDFPLCSEYDEKQTDIKRIIGHSTYKTKYEKKSPMDPSQHVLFVKCLKSTNIHGPCGFNTLYNADTEKINLKEDEVFTQFIVEGEKDYYKIDFSGERTIKEVYVDLMIFTGDVSFRAEDSKFFVKKLFNANKIFYIIKVNETIKDKEINFSVLASKNSYYSIEFMFVRENDDSWITNIIETGISHLITIDPGAKDSQGELQPYKKVKFSNMRMLDNQPFLVQFYSLNCILNVTAKREDDNYEEIRAFDQYYQDIILKENKDYEYTLRIKETDSSLYNNKLCMVYSSGLELIYDEEELEDRQILISDNEPKQMVFTQDEYEEIEYLYPLANSSNDVIINFNLLDNAMYTITIYFDYQKESKYLQTGNDLIYLIHDEWKNICKENEVCPIIIKIKLTKTYVEKEPKLLISVKAVQGNNPTYLTKNKAKLDFLLGNNWQYYYTDLGKDDEGDVIVNYRRGSGRLYGKIVHKNATTPESGATWREMYTFPSTVNESLKFYGYIKKIIISKNDTKECEEGCYLLLSLKTSINSLVNGTYEFREHPFSIIIHTRSSDDINDIPIVNIPLNEYIIGNLYTHSDNNIYEYYSIIFTHDSNKTIIDFQSKVINLYVKVGINKPTLDSYDFKFENKGMDSIFEISKDEIIKKCIENNIDIPYENSLYGLSITLGLWTNKTDSFYTTVYSMRVHLPFDNRLVIYEVKSDQKTLCKTQKVNNGYRCLFVVFFLGIDDLSHLVIYPIIQDHSSYNMYANFIFQENYDFFDYTYLNSKIPNYESKYSTEKTGLDYIYIEHGELSNEYVFVSVITQTETTVELLSSFYTRDYQLSPNPSSPQLFLINNDFFLFEFTTYEDLIVTIQSICGKGNIFWETDTDTQYALNGKEKIISLPNSIINKTDTTRILSNLYIKNNNKIKSNTCPGFGFYIDYLLRPSEVNLEEIMMGKSTQIAYRNTDFPVYIYSKLTNTDKDANIFVTLNELIGEKYSIFTTGKPFEIKSALVTDTEIMNSKLNPKLLNNIDFKFDGVYDPMIRTGHVFINKDNINKIDDEIPNVLIKVAKNNSYPDMKNFTRIDLEASVIQENSHIPISPEVYEFGKLSLSRNQNVYKLKTDKSKKYMIIEYAPNSKYTKYTISTNPGESSNSNFDEYKDEFKDGKQVITFNSNAEKNDYIYLNIFHDNDKKKNKSEKLKNYIFKYTNSDSTDYIKYNLTNSQIKVDSKKENKKYDYTVSFNPVKLENSQITYFVKFVAKKDFLDGEKDNSIAIRESTSYVEEVDRSESTGSKIIRLYEGIDEIKYRYVHVIALIRDNNGTTQFVGYESIYVKDSIAWKIALIVIAAVIVLLVIVYLIHIYIKRKRNINRNLDRLKGPMVSRYTEASLRNDLNQ